MFEFTKAGIIILIVGCLYLLTLGRYLVPRRIDPEENIIEEYKITDFLTEVIIEEDSPLVGKSVGETLSQSGFDLDLVQIIRSGEQFMEPLNTKTLQANDHLIIRTDHDTLLQVIESEGLKLLPEIKVTKKQLEQPLKGQKLLETVIPRGSFLEGQTLAEVNFLERYDTTVAIRQGYFISLQLL